MLTRGQRVSVAIEKPAAGGRMIARVDGQVVLVEGVIPGERATVAIDRLGKGVAYGDPVSIDEPSRDRREGTIDLACGGCLFAHIAYPRQVALKAEIIADALRRIGKIEWSRPIVVAESPDAGYRMRARLHLRNGVLGFFREGTHTVCDPRRTRQLLPEACDMLDAFHAAWTRSGSTGDAEIEVAENVAASERVVHLEPAPSARVALIDWAVDLPHVSGMTVADAGGAAPVMGDAYVRERMMLDATEIVLQRHVLAFFQGNRYLLESLVRLVAEQIGQAASVIDLYAGVGLFSMAAASRGARVTAVEGDRVSAQDLDANARAGSGAVEPVHQSVERFLERRHATPDVVLVDPPRTGMSKEALSGAIALGASRVIYVSCDVATFARDARQLLAAGYTMSSIDAFDLFPNTPHVETVATFTRP